jgi:prepilin-type processing-associated H-X9-DG protein
VSDFKLTAKETLGEQNTQVIEFTVTEMKDVISPAKWRMKMWLDAQTNLPVKLTMTMPKNKLVDISVFSDTYSEFTIDAKVNDNLFELPKVPAPKDLKNEGKGDTEERLVGTWQYSNIRVKGEDLPIHLFDERLGFTPIMLFAKDGTGMNDVAVGPDGMGFKYKLSGPGVIWTRPEDLTLPREKDKLPAVGGLFKNGITVLFCDGHVQFIRSDSPPAMFRAIVTPSGGKVVDFEMLEPKEK